MHLLLSCLAVAAVFFLLHVDVAPAACAAPGTFVYARCSPSRYAPNTPFESNLNSLLASMASTASSGATYYNTFTSDGAGAGAAAAYGLYQCRGDLPSGECVACVRDTVARLGEVCAGATAASVQSDGCHVRYGGVRRDLAVVSRADDADASSVAYHHQCSAGTSGDAWFLRSRDAVLSELQGGVDNASGYKVSASGPVQGVAQCLGGVAAADCAACLAQAAAQLHGACGAALAADVYLVQCSVRYWTNANYVRSSQGNPEDDAGRTVAIAIGISAGVAALVVFISFLRKACSS